MKTNETIEQFSRMLKGLDRWLELGGDGLVEARLAPDQYPLNRQVQAACDQAKFAAAYLSGQEAPSHPDTETTLEELRERIQKCLSYLGGFKPEDFSDAETRRVAPRWLEGRSLVGSEYLQRFAVPNFYFHITTAYSILRHSGVSLGKRDYIGITSWKELGT